MNLTPRDEINLHAFLVALAQQTEPLPPGLQAQLHAIGQNLTNRVMELATIAATIPSLDNAFHTARSALQTQDGQRSKGVIPAPFTPADQINNTELSNSAVQILTSPDSVKAAKAHQGQNNHLIHPPQPTSTPNPLYTEPQTPTQSSQPADQSPNFIQRIFRRS